MAVSVAAETRSPVMVDWLSCSFRSEPHTYDTGRVIVLGPAGEIQTDRPGFVAADLTDDDDEPSSSRTWKVATSDCSDLFISGNPAKLLNPEGHNLWGSADLWGQTLHAGQRIRKAVGCFPSPATWDSCRFGVRAFTRLDLTRSYRFPSEAEAKAWIQHVAGASRSRHGAATLHGGSTAYFGSRSKRWAFKVYAKRDEFLNGKARDVRARIRDGLMGDVLADWAAGVVRFELTLRSLELKSLAARDICGKGRGHEVRLTDPSYLESLWVHYYGRIEWNRAMSHRQPELLAQSLSGAQRAVFALWQTGMSWQQLQGVIPARNTLWRHRKAIQAATGVDIAAPRPESAAPEIAAELDPKGWDPEPLTAVTEPDPNLSLLMPYRKAR